MEREFRLPDIGEGLTEAEIVRWLVAEGERVEVDQPVVEVETDKAVVEIPSPYGGTVVRHGGAEGETVEVGTVLVVIGEESDASVSADADAPDSELEPASSDRDPMPTPEKDVRLADSSDPDFEESVTFAVDELASIAPIVGSISEDAEILTHAETDTGPAAPPVKALPVVRKLARDKGVDLATVTGTGPQGRITRDDVLAAVPVAPPEPSKEREPVPTGEPAATPEEEVRFEADAGPTLDSGEELDRAPGPRDSETRTMSRLRLTIAANMARSWSEVPHVTTFDDVDASRLLEARAALAGRHEMKIPLEALVVRAVLPAIDEFPEFNATLDGEELTLHGNRDIGIAVDTADGLLVAVIRDAGDKGVLQLANEIERLGIGAKTRSLTREELTGQTFTISNIGAVGGGHGTPIVPPGTTAILSVGRARDKVIVDEGDIVIAPMMPLSLSYDHRVVDGGLGRRFMARVIENLEEPALFLAG